MSSLSPTKDGTRKTPRKFVGQKSHYLAGEYNKYKGWKGGKKSGGGVKKLVKERDSSLE